jgi:hypothetical protein
MGQLLTLLWDICRLRRGPQDLPYSPQILLSVCAFILCLQFVAARLLGLDRETLVPGVLSLVFNFGVLYALLSIRSRKTRFVQTALALVCCGLMFSLVTLPITLAFGTPPQTPEQMTSLQFLLGMVTLLLVVWKTVVDAHILRHSLDVPFLAGVVIAVLWLIAELALGSAAGGGVAA